MTGQRTAPPALTEPAAETAAVPRFYRVASRREDTADTVTLELTEPAQSRSRPSRRGSSPC